MTEEEEIEYLKSVEDATEEYFRLQGYDIDMSEMSTEELEGFFLNLPSSLQVGYRDYVSLVTKGSLPPSDPFDIGVEAMMPLTVWGIPVWFPGSGVVKHPLKWGKNLVGKGLKWLDKLIKSADELEDVAGYTRVAATTRRPAQAAGGSLRSSRSGQYMSRQPRTAAGSGTPLPPPATPGMRDLRFGAATAAMGATAAAVGTYEAGQFLGSEEAASTLNPTDLPQESTEIRQSDLIPTFDEMVGGVHENPHHLQQIIYKDISEQAAFDKLTNWVGGKSIWLVGNGQSLYEALKEHHGPAGLGEMYMMDLNNDEDRQTVVEYFTANWETVKPISDIVKAGGGRIILDDVVQDYVSDIQQTSPFMLMLPGSPGEGMIGVIPTFDGTAHGTITSLNDLTTGGKIGPLNLLPFLKSARPEQLVMWQQQLYAWGYLERPPEVWGQLTPDRTGVPPTLTAAHTWQIDVFNVGIELTREGVEISPDGTPRADRVLDTTIARRAAYTTPKTTSDRALKDEVIGNAAQRVSDYLTATGRYLPTGAVEQLRHGLTRELNKLSPSRSEELFGQGGSRRERLLAENLLREFYGIDDWGAALMVGNGSFEQFYDYSQMVGAVSEEERNLLEAGGLARRNYDPGLQNRNVNEAQQDVAVAALLKFLGDEGSAQDIMGMNVNDLVNALNVYSHTLGSSRGMTRNFTQRDLIEMASRALTNTQQAVFQPDNTAQRVADDYVDSADIGSGIAGYKYRQIVNELNKVASSPGYLRTPNV